MDKELEKMEQSQLDLLFPVKISVYDEKWPELYLSEKSLIEKALGDEVLFRIRHFGSTSVPGLCAKPTIDILAEVNNTVGLEYIIKAFREIGYNYAFQPRNPAPHMMFMKGYTLKGFSGQAYHVHVRYPGDWDEIYFRDYLISHPEVAHEYETLKRELSEKYANDREAYTAGKSGFVRDITELARIDMLRYI